MKKLFIGLIVILTLSSCNKQNQVEMDSQNVKLVKQYFEFFNQHNWEKLAAMYSEKPEFKDPSLGSGVVVQTRDQIVKKYSELNAVFPNLKDTIIQMYPSGENHIIVEFLSSGTAQDHTSFELPICTIFTIKNGVIEKDYTYYDNFEE